ncbi:MAG TPA: nitronate monooxygenase, partial [Burkholderiaceae bacterium]|nr:nitronate monooxygenase [Burkholderiaceae bacterium]
YIGSPFIATEEANAPQAYKQMIVDSGAQDIVYTDYFSGVHGNYLMPSIVAAGIDPEVLNAKESNRMNFGSERERPKTWSQIWGAGQGIGAIGEIQPAARFIERLADEYRKRLREIAALAGTQR